METIIIKMTLAESENLSIHYMYNQSKFGNLLLAATEKGVCYAAFDSDQQTALAELKAIFPKAIFLNQSNDLIKNALLVFEKKQAQPILLHIKGTVFQMEVWEELLKIPFGETTTYGEIARRLHNPKASRAVGSAVGANPVSFIIPCHRVLQSTGKIGGYHWGVERKIAILEWELGELRVKS
ncbi:MAG: methylated-DNA--[protein]-cysteine S-methyltransferase [Prevotellaceae bacterium]|jgi:AraC family transcriptional regulator of adaptative response/methylated-DNA-[protein]-cysteine methyltransferase|nr:methylated-DNA--[protein]-cysteine S-methyltransferase [Prevotellaceae bacterium]